MIAVVGHDKYGRPIKIGDRVILVDVTNPFSDFQEGAIMTVSADLGVIISPSGYTAAAFRPLEDRDYKCFYDSVVKLNVGHEECGSSFEEVIRNLKGGRANARIHS